MPFTTPTTYASVANTAFGATLEIGDSSSPPTYTALTEVKTFDIDGISLPDINNGHLLSPNNTDELVPGMIRPGKISVSGNYIGDTAQLNLPTLAQNRTIFPFRIKAPMQRQAKTLTITGSGFIASFKEGSFENNKSIDFSADIQITGSLTRSVA